MTLLPGLHHEFFRREAWLLAARGLPLRLPLSLPPFWASPGSDSQSEACSTPAIRGAPLPCDQPLSSVAPAHTVIHARMRAGRVPSPGHNTSRPARACTCCSGALSGQRRRFTGPHPTHHRHGRCSTMCTMSTISMRMTGSSWTRRWQSCSWRRAADPQSGCALSYFHQARRGAEELETAEEQMEAFGAFPRARDAAAARGVAFQHEWIIVDPPDDDV